MPDVRQKTQQTEAFRAAVPFNANMVAVVDVLEVSVATGRALMDRELLVAVGHSQNPKTPGGILTGVVGA